MKEEILSNIQNPVQLETLYRNDKSGFKYHFNLLYPELQDQLIAGYWHARLNEPKEEISWGSRKELFVVLGLALIAGLIAKIPAFAGLEEDLWYSRNIGFVVFPALAAYFAWKNRLSFPILGMVVGAMVLGLVFINLLPEAESSDTLMLSKVHLLLFLYFILGITFAGSLNDTQGNRLKYLKYNGDVVVMSALILIAGGIMTGVTIGLFSLIGWNIEEFYFNYVFVFGLSAVPIFATYLTQTNPQLVGKVSPVIAKIFSPLVLVMLLVYLSAILFSGKDPYNDREFLLIFNLLLVGVMAIIFFSVAEAAKDSSGKFERWVLFLLSIVTIAVNAIALSAILFRISEWGITPNRLAVLGGNILILINLLLVTLQLTKVLKQQAKTSSVGNVIAKYLPIYVLWTIIVTFLFPFLFGFK
jgi:hypothetical protein